MPERAAAVGEIVDGCIERIRFRPQVVDIALNLGRVTLDRRAKGGQGKDEHHERGMEEHGVASEGRLGRSLGVELMVLTRPF